MIKKVIRWWLVAFGLLAVNIIVFIGVLGSIINQLIVVQKPVNFKTIQVWQGLGWWLRPTRAGVLVKTLPEMIGCNKAKYYFVLLQNRYELRASGGIMGSYARLKFDNCGLAEIKVADIYEPDGQIPGHVEPPSPIQEAFQQGWYKLRDSNWEIDFSKSAQVIAWFFEKGNEAKPDGIIALNFDLVLDLLKKVGPLYLPDFKQEIMPDNFYEIVQARVEEGFFPGSTQKRDFLTALESAFRNKIEKANLSGKIGLAHIVFDHLKRGEILLFSFNTEVQEVVEASEWSGKLDYAKYTGVLPICTDYLYSVESNMGANKANRFVERTVNVDVTKDNNRLVRKVTINLINRSPVNIPDEDPLLYGGIYFDYHRLVIPIESEEIVVSVGGEVLDTQKVTRKDFKDSNLSEIGFWAVVPREQELELNIEYQTTEKPGRCLYRLDYQRQPGTGEYLLEINGDGKSFFNKSINSDKVIYRWVK